MAKSPINELEQAIRRSRPEPISDEYRERIVGIFETLPACAVSSESQDSTNLQESEKAISFPHRRWIYSCGRIAAVLVLLLCLTAMYHFRTDQASDLTASHHTGSTPHENLSDTGVEPRTLVPTQLTSYQLHSRPVSPVMLSDNRPVRLMKNEHLDQLKMHDPSTGKSISVTYPKTDYQFVPCSIQ